MSDALPARTAERRRETSETRIEARVALDRPAEPRIDTGLGFLDHMLAALAVHGGLGIELSAAGDLDVDDHHTVEDCAIVLGGAVSDSLGDRAGIRRFGHAYAPLDEALARAVIDVSGRPHATIDLGLVRERLGDVACENLSHFFRSFAMACAITLHLDVLRGENDHHRAEAAFKAFALALRAAVRRDGSRGVPSTKGVLDGHRSGSEALEAGT
ncbi:MAG: imidazoleglycerol-phosphate dehydratase HisB [Gemmatimonadota bacterium]|nr:imidazoleglycerol-phosphate dehydratase HisB [Gemmatimonadota bacterium]